MISYSKYVKSFSELTLQELYAIIKLRVDVFVVEQDCVYPDLDDKDQDALHVFYISEEGELFGYLRILNKGTSYEEMAIGRVIIAEKYRRYKLGERLMKDGIEEIEKLGESFIRISAQEHLKSFYERVGFKQVSDMYLEDGIPHIEMLKG